MNRFARFCRGFGLPGGVVFFLTLAIYILLFSRRVLLDITAQVQTLVKVCHGEVALPPTALFYVLTWLAAFGQCHFTLLMGAAAAVLAGLAAAKWWATRHVFQDYFGAQHPANEQFGWLALALAFVCSLPVYDWWLLGYYIKGQPSPNYWMNGTVLASWPFAVLLFWQSYRQLQSPEAGWWRRMLLWLVLLVVSKPSYAFVFALVYPLFLAGRHGFGRAVRRHFVPLGLLGLLVAIEYYLVFLQKDSVYVRVFNRGEASGVDVCLFCVWKLYSSNIPLSVLAGVAFPVATAMAFWRELRQKLLFWYAWAGFFTAIAISAVFTQKGEEFTCWNFRWQTYIAAYLLFTVSVLFVWEKISADGYRMNGRTRRLAFLFLLHLLSGFVYIVKMWWTRSHY